MAIGKSAPRIACDPIHVAVTRCEWASGGSEPMLEYHDAEWGVPSHDDRHLFEMLTLEGAQAGLSWSTILNKREGYSRAFAGFDPAAVARFTEKDVERLLEDTGIVRNRLKVESTVANAARVLEVQQELGSFDAYLWAFVEGEPVVGSWRSLAELPAETDLSRALQATSSGAAFGSSGRRSATRSCRPSEWSTTTRSTAIGSERSQDECADRSRAAAT